MNPLFRSSICPSLTPPTLEDSMNVSASARIEAEATPMAAETKSGTVLDRIIEARRAAIAHRKKSVPETALRFGVKHALPLRDFAGALTRDSINVIAELKKASPSRGLIRADFDPVALAKGFEGAGAAALSVLTEEEFFQGELKYMKEARAAVGLPVLRKDFIIDEHQVYEAREAGADAILLIAAMMPPAKLKELKAVADELSMLSLVEVHDARELDVALRIKPGLLGINNRNLNDFSVKLQTSVDLLRNCPDGLPVVSESGIFTREDCLLLRKSGACAVLVGEAFMTAPDLEAAVKALMPDLTTE
jgi:indole-3-glycerol phosphate synthase